MIRSIDGKPDLSPLVPNQTGSKQAPSEPTTPPQQSDRIELSDEARAALRNPELAKRQRIQAGIEAGFYNSPQVLQAVAQRLLRDLDSTSGSQEVANTPG